MTEEERQRTMDFILATQANTTIKLDQIADDVRSVVRVTNDLVTVSRESISRIKRVEGRTDSIEETLKFFRELWEANLRRPENPPQTS
jgi:hypothetical protein